MNRLRASVANITPWYRSEGYALNRVMPSFIHDYTNQRFWNISAGETANPFLSARTGNAMQFDNQGRLVWAPANMVGNSSTSGAVLGVVGSGGAFPTNWQRSTATGIIHEIINITPDYIDFRIYGTNGTGATIYPQVTFMSTPLSGTPGTKYTGSAYVTVLAAPNLSGFATSAMKLNTQFLNSGTYSNEATPSPIATTSEQRLVSQGAMTAAPANQVRVSFNLSINIAGTVDATFRIGRPQLEFLGADSPKTYLETTGTARYLPRLDYDPNTLAARGYLIEAAKTNLLAISETSLPSDWNNASFCTATYPGDIWNRPISRITVTSTASSQFNYISANPFTPSASTLYTISGFFKKGNISRVQLTTSANFTDAYMNYNFDTNTIVLGGANVTAGSGHAQLMQGGWVRLQYSFTSIAVPVGGTGALLAFIDTDAALRLAGTATNGAFFDCFGFQVELQGVATSYIPTFGTTATRVTDSTIITPLPWLTQNLGTFVVELFSNKAETNLRRYIDMNDSTASNRIQIARSASGAYIAVSTVGGTSEFNPATSPASPNFQVDKVALRYNSAGKAVVCNNGTVGSTATSPPTSGYTTLFVGQLQGLSDANSSMGWLRQIRYYADDSASNAQLQAITV